jgi:Plasmid encoded RepA protein
MLNKSVEKLFQAALAIESDSALGAGELGFMARAMTLCTLPHSKPKEQEFTRKNGNYTMSMVALKSIGLPYGTIPRLLLAWISTEAVRTQNRTLVLGDSLSHFLKELGLSRSGGERGDITRFKDQLKRLFSCTISCNYHSDDRDAGMGFRIAQKYDLWWHPQQPDQAGLWESTLTLSEEFYDEITKSPIPIDMRALKSLKRSPLALDIYIWLTFRTSYIKAPVPVSWGQLQGQFGAEYKRPIDFKVAFTDALRKVQVVYPGANITKSKTGIVLASGTTSVPKIGNGKTTIK